MQDIRSLNYEEYVKSSVSISHGRPNIVGDQPLESFYYHPEIINFNYKNSHYRIGKWRKKFNGNDLYKLINNKIT